MRVYLVAGLGYGDEGKGSVVDYLARVTGARLVVRYNGGPQAAHNVIDIAHHVFSQFGSSSMTPHGAVTYLSRFMLVDPIALINEMQVLRPKCVVRPRVMVEESAVIVTSYHAYLNMVRERLRGDRAHGSCGIGIGVARERQINGQTTLYAGDLRSTAITKEKLCAIRQECAAQALEEAQSECFEIPDEAGERFRRQYRRFTQEVEIVADDTISGLLCVNSDPVIFEGAQGMLIDEKYGFAPHNTWTNITFDNAYKILENVDCEIFRIGVLRTYHTRHGYGPFPTEDPNIRFPDHNTTGPWQGAFRQGILDQVATQYALKAIGGVDGIALNCLDRQTYGGMLVSTHYEHVDGREMWRLPEVVDAKFLEGWTGPPHARRKWEEMEGIWNTPVVIRGRGPSAADKDGDPGRYKAWRRTKCL